MGSRGPRFFSADGPRVAGRRARAKIQDIGIGDPTLASLGGSAWPARGLRSLAPL